MNTIDTDVRYEVADGVATITLDRPDKLNAMSTQMRRRLRERFDAAAEDDEVRCVLLTGAGERAFSAGADLSEVGTRGPMQRRAMYDHEPATILRRFPKPVVAAIRGYAVGGGLELACACDIRIASTDAKLGYPEIGHGWIPAGGGTQSLPRLVGMGKAMELVLTGRTIDSEEALRIGLVDFVYPVDEFPDAAEKLTKRIASANLGALLLAKSALRMSENVGSDAGHLYERELGALAYTLEGRAEALERFHTRSKDVDR